jgi:hypothetical protein
MEGETLSRTKAFPEITLILINRYPIPLPPVRKG